VKIQKKKDDAMHGCGQMGHMRGAEECKAGKDAVWGRAPKAYLEKIQKKFEKMPTSKKREFSSESKQICPNWSSGDGYCRFAERCHFSHDGPQGGSKRARDFSKGKGNGKGKGRGKGKGIGKSKGRGGRGRTPGSTSMIVKKKRGNSVDEKDKRESSMMVSQQGSEELNHDNDVNDAEEELYNLLRGMPH
jgi:hypothetical protein